MSSRWQPLLTKSTPQARQYIQYIFPYAPLVCFLALPFARQRAESEPQRSVHGQVVPASKARHVTPMSHNAQSPTAARDSSTSCPSSSPHPLLSETISGSCMRTTLSTFGFVSYSSRLFSFAHATHSRIGPYQSCAHGQMLLAI